MPEVVYKFKQKSFLKDTRTFTVYDDDTIRASYSDFGRVYEYCRLLADFEPAPQTRIYHNSRTRARTVIVSALTVGFLVLGLNADTPGDTEFILYGLAVVFALCTFLSLITLRRENKRVLLFVAKSGDNLFDNIALLWQLPSPESFEEFVKFLKTRIAQARARSPQSGPQSIAQQLQELARLKEEGHLTLYEFEKAKALLIDGREKP